LRLVFLPESIELAHPQSASLDKLDARDDSILRDAQSLAASLGIAFNASGAADPSTSVKKKDSRDPWVVVPPAVDTIAFHRA
jgi:hypothetical protein